MNDEHRAAEKHDILGTGLRAFLIAVARLDIPSLVFSVILAALLYFGMVYGVADSDALDSATAIAIDKIGWFVIYAVVAYLVTRCATVAMDWHDAALVPSGKNPTYSAILRQHLLLYAAILLVCWLVWLVPHYPGAFRDDTMSQMLQTFGVWGYFTQHPLFDTLIFGAFWQFGDALGSLAAGLFLFLMIQCVLTAAVLSAMVCYLEKVGAPRWFLIASIFFLCISPVMFQSVSSMSKDALNGIVFVAASIILFEVIRTNGRVLHRTPVLVSFIVVVALCCLTKRTMQPVLACVLVAELIVLLVRHEQIARFVVSAVAGVLVIPVAASGIMISALGAVNDKTYEIWSIPTQSITRVVALVPDALSDDEHDAVNGFMDIDQAVCTYSPREADYSWHLIRENASMDEELRFLGTWFSVGTRYPKVYFDSIMYVTGGYLDPTAVIASWESPDALINDRLPLWSAGSLADDARMRELFGPITLSNTALAPRICGVEETVVTRMVDMGSPLFGTYGVICLAIPLFALFVGTRRNRGRGFVMALLPCLVLGTLIVSSIAFEPYTVPLAYCASLFAYAPIAGMPLGKGHRPDETVS